MIKLAAMVLLGMWLASCAVYDATFGLRREAIRQPGLIVIPETYTKAEVDAINAEATCRALARTPLQAGRCGVRRP